MHMLVQELRLRKVMQLTKDGFVSQDSILSTQTLVF